MALASVPLVYNVTIEQERTINIKLHVVLLYQTTIHCHVWTISQIDFEKTNKHKHPLVLCPCVSLYPRK